MVIHKHFINFNCGKLAGEKEKGTAVGAFNLINSLGYIVGLAPISLIKLVSLKVSPSTYPKTIERIEIT
ncbi:hypothetical protein [Thermococcus sp. MV5]|uniref:hypothetical protein n=1 Tax=Thermococcus sp. MV5 TaxID=1638272 RepID=UPI0019807062|nr:hypothetical protein [Thermococcus sp. MV5]